MKKLLITVLSLISLANLFAVDLTGRKIVDTGPSPIEGLSFWAWSNDFPGFFYVKRIQMITTRSHGASWILRHNHGDLVMITTTPEGETVDFGADYMQLEPGEALDVFLHAETGSVYLWGYYGPASVN